jgi:hypothetical protein
MSTLQETTVYYINHLSDDKLKSVLDFAKYLYEQDKPLDDFDYELAKHADQNPDKTTIPFDEVLMETGLSYADLSD